MQCRDSGDEPQTDIATHSDFSSTAEMQDTVTGSCAKVQRTPGVRIDGLVERMSFELKIDTCAMIIFIMWDLCDNFPPEYRPVLERVYQKIEISDGSALKRVGIVNIRLTSGNEDVYFRVFVGGIWCNYFVTKVSMDYRNRKLNCVHV